MKGFPPALCLFLIVCALALVAVGDGPVPISATPPAVQKAILAAVGGGQLQKIDQSVDAGETVFDVAFTGTAGIQGEFTFADDGAVLSVGVALNDLSDTLHKAIQDAAGDSQILGIDKNLDTQEVTYDVEVSKNGQSRTFTIADDGDVVSMQVALADTPAPVQKFIAAQLGGATLDSIDENLDPNGNDYDVSATLKNGARISFSVTDAGELESTEVTLNQLPRPAQNTILQQVGSGKILRIDRDTATGRRRGGAFEVESRINGKDYDFTVGPKGRFLGEDQ